MECNLLTHTHTYKHTHTHIQRDLYVLPLLKINSFKSIDLPFNYSSGHLINAILVKSQPVIPMNIFSHASHFGCFKNLHCHQCLPARSSYQASTPAENHHCEDDSLHTDLTSSLSFQSTQEIIAILIIIIIVIIITSKYPASVIVVTDKQALFR